jgi:hypothetical protein
MGRARLLAEGAGPLLPNKPAVLVGFEKELELIGVRATAEKIELQYRTQTTQGKPWDITVRLLKVESEWKVDSCDGRGQYDRSPR